MKNLAIYHLEAKIISRGAGRSAVAASAYMSCSEICNEYDGVQHDYTGKHGLVWEKVFLPPVAPQEWSDRAILWNAVEAAEKTKDSRLAREFVVALPIELAKEEWIALLTEFIRANFVADGMCADVAVHDTDGHNPHAHIMLTVRPLKEGGTWQNKTEKEYLCVRGNEESGLTAAEFKTAQEAGWEKQYQYKVGRKKVYMAPSVAEAKGYERASKHPKSTKYGRQNPIAERWNSEEQLLRWREAWADTVNRHLECLGYEDRIDHRSHDERGIDEQPTIHEGVAARITEQQGGTSDRCELNRQIKADNALLRELKMTVKKLMEVVLGGVAAIAEAMENLRRNMIIFRYQLLHITHGKQQLSRILETVKPDHERYSELVNEIKTRLRERKSLAEEKKRTPTFNIFQLRELSRKIAKLTEDLEELRSEKAMLLRTFECSDDAGMKEVTRRIGDMEAQLQKLNRQESKYSTELDEALTEYRDLEAQAVGMDQNELNKVRQSIRAGKEREAMERLKAACQRSYDPQRMNRSREDIAALLGERTGKQSIHQQIRQYKQEAASHTTRKNQQQER